jgi:hypothetical protein
VTVAGAQARDYATHIKEKHGNVKVGANWTPVGIFSARAEVFTKDHENHFDGFGTANPTDFYYLNYDMYGAKLTATIKPTPTVAFTSRYIHQRGKASTADAGLGSIDSGDTRRHQFGETVDWNPSKAFYAQANANIVFDTIITSYPKVTGAAKDVLHNSDNNYIDGDVVLGTAVTKEADLQLRATYYRANNYDTSLVATTLPYGAGAKEYTVSAGLKYKIDAKTVASAKIGYAESVNDTTGGNTNFRGPLAYVSLEHAF